MALAAISFLTMFRLGSFGYSTSPKPSLPLNGGSLDGGFTISASRAPLYNGIYTKENAILDS